MSNVVEEIIAGNMTAVAHLIRDIDDGIPEARDILKELYPHTGNAYIIGITGSPGVGKSTLVDQLIKHLRKKEKTVGVLAIDPTSPFTGGAILGDRVRMQRHSIDEGVFIRSMATRGHFGGLSQSTRSAVNVLDAMGKDYVIIETVGVGQDEVDIAKSAQTTVIVIVPGMGDAIQAIKAGILEVGDIFTINKSDREGVERTFIDLKMMLEMDTKENHEEDWKTPIIKIEAINDKGIVELLEEIENHRKFNEQFNVKFKHKIRRERIKDELSELVKNRIVYEVFKQLISSGEFEKAINSIIEGRIDPYSACEQMILPILKK